MWRYLVLLFFLSISQGRYLNNPSAESIYGTYKLIYTWPKLKHEWTSQDGCLEVTYSKANSSLHLALSCQCERTFPNLALVIQQIESVNFILLADIVNNYEELQEAVDDHCTCALLDKAREAILKVDDNHLLHREIGRDNRSFLVRKTASKSGEAYELIRSFSKLIGQDGSPLCWE